MRSDLSDPVKVLYEVLLSIHVFFEVNLESDSKVWQQIRSVRTSEDLLIDVQIIWKFVGKILT